jgi:hypothetical protein
MLSTAAMFVACNNEKKDDVKTTEASSSDSMKAPMQLAFTPAYSSSFEIGKPEYAAMIVQGSWKDWEMNTMDKKNWLADTIVAFHSDNSMASGSDSLMARWKRGRAGYTKVIDTIHSVLSVYSTDKKENWVLVWAQEINTDAKGKIDTTELMETWRINKDGKADRLYQYDRHTRKK